MDRQTLPRDRAPARARSAGDPTCATCCPEAAPDSVDRRVSRMEIARPGSPAAPAAAPNARRARPVSPVAGSRRHSATGAPRTPTAESGAIAIMSLEWGCASPTRPASRAAAPGAPGAVRPTVSARPARSARGALADPAPRTVSAVQTQYVRRRIRPWNVRAPSITTVLQAKRAPPGSVRRPAARTETARTATRVWRASAALAPRTLNAVPAPVPLARAARARAPRQRTARPDKAACSLIASAGYANPAPTARPGRRASEACAARARRSPTAIKGMR